MRISTLYPLAIVGLALVAAAATGLIAYEVAARALVQAAENKLVALRDARVANLGTRLQGLEQDLKLLGSSELVRTALPAFQRGYAGLGEAA